MKKKGGGTLLTKQPESHLSCKKSDRFFLLVIIILSSFGHYSKRSSHGKTRDQKTFIIDTHRHSIKETRYLFLNKHYIAALAVK